MWRLKSIINPSICTKSLWKSSFKNLRELHPLNWNFAHSFKDVASRCCIITMISITTVTQYIYKRKYTGRLCCFRDERFINFWLRFMVTRRERHSSYKSMLTILRWRAAHLVMFKISVGRDPKNPSMSLNGRNSPLCLHGPISTSQLTLFQNRQILRTISSGHDVIHTPASFPVWGFIMTMVFVISFTHERKLHQLTIHLGS